MSKKLLDDRLGGTGNEKAYRNADAVGDKE
jgi:hypothetical protein